MSHQERRGAVKKDKYVVLTIQPDKSTATETASSIENLRNDLSMNSLTVNRANHIDVYNEGLLVFQSPVGTSMLKRVKS